MNKSLLSSSFYVTAKLNCKINILKEEINKINFFIELKADKRLKYKIIKTSSKENKNFIEFTEDHIVLVFFFKSFSAELYNNNLNSFISIITFLKDFYEVKFSDLYPYILEALRYNWSNIVQENGLIDGLKERINSLNESNYNLSFHVLELSKRNLKYSKELKSYADFYKIIKTKIESRLKDLINKPQPDTIISVNIEFRHLEQLESLINVYEEVSN